MSSRIGNRELMSEPKGSTSGMVDSWKEDAMKIGAVIRDGAAQFPELIPLQTSWINFARKRGLRLPAEETDAFLERIEQYGMMIISLSDFSRLVSTIRKQAQEIDALEYRIKTLLGP